MKEDYWRNRLKELRDKIGYTQGMLSIASGISQSQITMLETGKKPFTQKVLEPLLEALNASFHDLFSIQEKKLPNLTIQTVPKMQTFHRDFADGKFVTVRLLHDQISAGSPAHINENDVDGYCIIYSDKDWMEHNPEDYTCVKVQGKSMYPILDSGDIVAIDHSERDPASLDKKMVAFRKDGGVTIKWLKVLEGGKVIVGVPENKDDFDSVISLQGKEIETGIVGKIAWWWAKRK